MIKTTFIVVIAILFGVFVCALCDKRGIDKDKVVGFMAIWSLGVFALYGHIRRVK
jgi:hypothetical protein